MWLYFTTSVKLLHCYVVVEVIQAKSRFDMEWIFCKQQILLALARLFFVGDFIAVISTAAFAGSAYNWIWLNTYHLCKQISAYTAALASVFGQGQVIEWTVGSCKYPHQYVEMAPIQRQSNHLLQSVQGNSGLLIPVNHIPPLHELSDMELVITLWKGCGNAFDSVGD